MVHDFHVTFGAAAETSRSVFVEKLEDNVHELVAVVDTILSFVGEDDARLPNFEEEQPSLFVIERRDSDEHFVDQDSKGPPVYGEVVTLLSNHFRG